MNGFRRVGMPILAALLTLAGLVGMGLAYEAWCSDRIVPGVHVWGLSVGGMQTEAAAAALEEELISGWTLALEGPERTWEVPLNFLGVRLAGDATARAAFDLGRGAGDDFWERLVILIEGRNLAPVLSFDADTARLYLETLAHQIDRAPVDAIIDWRDGGPVAHSAQAGRAVDVEASLAALRQALADPRNGRIELVVRPLAPQVVDAEAARALAAGLLAAPFALVLPQPVEGDPGPWVLPPHELAPLLVVRVAGDRLVIALDEEQARALLEGVALDLAVEPVDARFRFDRSTGRLAPLTASVDGRALDVEASLANWRTAVETGRSAATLIVGAVPPRFPDTATAQELGIVELVAEGDSYFIGSPSGRDHNVRLSASLFDGIVIAPGETFSFNHFLGEVTAEAGYDEAYVTTGEMLAIEVGGGICQVSTTIFRAALYGGYPIVERWPHRHRVGYYELRGYGPGLDATVYSPVVDVRFANDRAAPLLIETEIQENAHRLIVRIYSTDDGRRVEVDDPVITAETEPGPPIYQLDASMAPGTVIQWQTAANGLTVTVERRVYDAGEQVVYRDRIVSQYSARRAAYRHGPGYQLPVDGD